MDKVDFLLRRYWVRSGDAGRTIRRIQTSMRMPRSRRHGRALPRLVRANVLKTERDRQLKGYQLDVALERWGADLD